MAGKSVALFLFQKHPLPLKNVFTEPGFENSLVRTPASLGGWLNEGASPAGEVGVPAPSSSQLCRLQTQRATQEPSWEQAVAASRPGSTGEENQRCLVKVLMYPSTDHTSGTSHFNCLAGVEGQQLYLRKKKKKRQDILSCTFPEALGHRIEEQGRGLVPRTGILVYSWKSCTHSLEFINICVL